MIGAILFGRAEPLDAFPELGPDHFHDFRCRRIFLAAAELHGAGEPVDSTTVLHLITASGALESLGGAAGVLDFPVVVSQAGYFFGRLCAQLTLRRALETATWARSVVQQHDTDARAFAAEYAQRVAGLDAGGDSSHILPAMIEQVMAELDRMDRGEVLPSLRTPLDAWNRTFGGLIAGGYYALGGRPGTGKTALMEQMVEQFCANNEPVLVFEKDMNPRKFVERLACRAADVPYWRYVRRLLNRAQRDQIRYFLNGYAKSPLRLHNPVGLTAEKLCAIARREIKQFGVKAVFLDHIQALRVGNELREGLTQASLMIRTHVTETDVPHVVLFHVNREGAQGRPRPEHVKEFDQLLGDVDGMAMLWSEVDPTTLKHGEPLPMKLFAAKNRDGGVSEEDMLFDGELLRFRDVGTPAPAVDPVAASWEGVE